MGTSYHWCSEHPLICSLLPVLNIFILNSNQPSDVIEFLIHSERAGETLLYCVLTN